MDYAEVIASVSHAEALTVRCPRCLSGPGYPCTYLKDQKLPRRQTGWNEPRTVTRRQGDPTRRAHHERGNVITARRRREWARDSRPVTPARIELQEITAALRAWDLDEFGRLREWLRDWGWLLTEANLPHRPDGTLRGEPYLFGQD